jgi:DNA-directed RNA polymerase subunit alpha
MEKISLPTNFTVEADGDAKATFSIEPCFPGYGSTLGNSLRRVLLSSVPGAAVTAVKIKNASHEFTTIPGVAEDVVEIILNLKALRLKVHSDEPVKVTLVSDGEGKVTAANIEKNADVEVVNPQHYICKVTDPKVTVEMELTVEKGRGYTPVEMRDKENPEIGTMLVDAIFSPVRNVGFDVESMRVGQMTNYDRLRITVETDKTITPVDAMRYATEVLSEHFQFFQTSLQQQ